MKSIMRQNKNLRKIQFSITAKEGDLQKTFVKMKERGDFPEITTITGYSEEELFYKFMNCAIDIFVEATNEGAYPFERASKAMEFREKLKPVFPHIFKYDYQRF